MGSGLRVQLEDLKERLQKVSEELTDISEDLAELQVEGSFGDWVVVEEGRNPLCDEELTPISNLLRFSGPEEGLPELPAACLALAQEKLRGTRAQVEQKATLAFEAGFWCKVALETGTHYTRIHQSAEGSRQHRIVLYRDWPELHRRVTSIKCFEAALDCSDRCVWEAFDTLAETTIFCVGARLALPPLEKWISLF